jgi:hypothetical protein
LPPDPSAESVSDFWSPVEKAAPFRRLPAAD